MAAVSFQDIATAEECPVPSRTQLDAQIKKMREEASKRKTSSEGSADRLYADSLANIVAQEQCSTSYLARYERMTKFYNSLIASTKLSLRKLIYQKAIERGRCGTPMPDRRRQAEQLRTRGYGLGSEICRRGREFDFRA